MTTATFILTIAATPKARIAQMGTEEKAVLEIFGLLNCGRKKGPDGNYIDNMTACELQVWNGLGTALAKDGLDTGDRIAIACRIRGVRAYTDKHGEIKSILSLEAVEGAGAFPLVQKKRSNSDLANDPAF